MPIYFSVSARLLLTVFAVAALPVAAVVTALLALSLVQSETEQLTVNDIPLTKALTQVSFAHHEQAKQFERGLLFVERLETDSSASGEFDTAIRLFEENAVLVEKNLINSVAIATDAISRTDAENQKFPTLLSMILKIESRHAEFESSAFSVLRALRGTEVNISGLRSLDVFQIEDQLDQELKTALAFLEESTERSAQLMADHEERAIQQVIALILAALLVGPLVGIGIARTVTVPFKRAALAVEGMAKGDLTVEIPTISDRQDEVAVLIRAISNYRAAFQNAESQRAIAIREREISEEQIRQSESLFRTIFETVVDGVILIDQNGLIQVFNPACERLFGYNAGEVVGQNIKALMPEPYHQEHDAYIHSYKTTGKKKVIGIGREVEGRRKDGSTFPFDLSVAETTATSGRAFVGIIRDATERKRAEVEINKGAQRVRDVIDTAVDGMILIDQDGLVQVFNPACERLFGYDVSDVLGHNVKMLMPDPYQHEHDGYMHNYLTTGVRKVIGIGREVAGRRKDGSTFPMELSVGETASSQGRAFVGVIRDITEKKALQEVSERQLEEQNLALQSSLIRQKEITEGQRDFISTANHELRTPLSVIDGYARMIHRDISNERFDRISDRSMQIRAAVQQMQEVVEGALDSARLEAGKFVIEPVMIDVHALVKAAVTRQQTIWTRYTFDFTFAAEPMMLVADPKIMSIALSNLLSNAIKYSDAGTTITIRVHETEENVLIDVQDQGMGIADSDRDSIFEPYTRADTAKAKPGSGIGLSLARQLVRRHGGDITFESTVGEGAKFTISIHRQWGKESVDGAPPIQQTVT